MASLAKKRAVGFGEKPEESDNSSDENPEDEDDSGEEDSEASDEEINEVKEQTRLRRELFLKAHVNTSEMTDIIIQQNHVGSVVKQAEVPEDSDDDDDPDEVFGFITMLNLTERKGVQCVEEVKELIVDQCEKNASHIVTEQLEKIFNDNSKPVGLLLSERFINVPPQIALPLHKQLQEEIAEAQRTNKPSGRCHYCLIISKTCREETKSIPATGGAPKEEYMFVNAEEEFFYEQAILKFHYTVQEEADSCLSGRWSFTDVPMKPFRTVMLVPTDRMPAIMEKLKEYLSV
uniref:Protein BCCIP homolog n=1 Tax=Neolamprologus brichardi TaxID=32507 RepID=A0A3Q4H479_NEOBR